MIPLPPLPVSRRQALAAMCAACSPALAQRAGRLVVTFPAGSPPDALARGLVAALGAEGPGWVVDNRPGASGTIGSALVARANADGSHLLVGVPATLAIASLVFAELPYDMASDFVPVAGLASGAQVLAVASDSPQRSFDAWREAVQRGGAGARVGHAGIATSAYLLLRHWMREARLPLVPVAYSGVAAIVRDVLGGHNDVYLGPLGGVLEAVRAERMRLLAITGPERSSLAPGTPTLTELGLPEPIGALWTGIFARSGEPASRVQAWQDTLLRAVQTPAYAELLQSQAVAPLALDAQAFGELVAADRRRYAALAAALGLVRQRAG